jgi:hypothetical protein
VVFLAACFFRKSTFHLSFAVLSIHITVDHSAAAHPPPTLTQIINHHIIHFHHLFDQLSPSLDHHSIHHHINV